MASTIFEGECVSDGNREGGGFSRWECQKCGFSDEEITKETLEICPRCGNKLTKSKVPDRPGVRLGTAFAEDADQDRQEAKLQV